METSLFYEKHGWTPLIMAAKGGYTDVVTLLLAENPNVNAVDQDGRSALAWSSKEGFDEIVVKLLQKGAFLNMPDRHGDSPLILAAKEGHSDVVHTLVASYADMEMADGEGKTPLYIAVEKGHVEVVSELLSAGANIETTHKDGETPLLRGAKKKHTQCVKLLIEKGANISAVDKKGDNLFHIIVRNKYIGMCELLTNEPKHKQLLHQVNKAGETPQSIDAQNNSRILSHICTGGQYNQSFDKLDLSTQQDILITSLGKYIVEPSLSIPMTVGMYSRWGSGKSLYVQKLVELLCEFKENTPFKPFTVTVLLVFACLAGGINFGIIIWAASNNWIAGFISGACLAVVLLLIFMLSRFAILSTSKQIRISGIALATFFHRFILMAKLVYCVPPLIEEFRPILPVHLIMVDLSQNIIIANSPMTSLVRFTHELNDAIEKDLGFFIPRLYRVFRTTPHRNCSENYINFQSRCKKTCCCLPSFIITIFIFLCLLIGVILYRIHGTNGPTSVIAIQIACCCVFGGGLIAIVIRCIVMIYCLCLPMKRRVEIVSNQDEISEETFLAVLKQELDTYVEMLECVDGFNRRQTRVIIYIDLVDSLEQQKVLSLINTVNLLVTEPGHPFILVLSVDPRLLIKAVDHTLSNMQGPVISPCEYLKNMVDLPFYINDYPKIQADRVIPAELYHQIEEKQDSSGNEEIYEDNEWLEDTDELFSGSSHITDIENGHISLGNSVMMTDLMPNRSGKFSLSDSVSSTDNIVSTAPEDHLTEDISHLLRNNENNTINDVRRIMNIVSLNGRLLLCNDMPFQWTRLAIWVSFCDGWPYKSSWITLLCLDTSLNLPGCMTIQHLHGLFGYLIPQIGDRSLGTENSNTYFETFISSHKPAVNVSDARSFSAFMFYVDPTIRKLMLDYLFSTKAISGNQQAVQKQGSVTSSLSASTSRNDEFLWRSAVTPEILLRMTVDDVATQLLEIEGLEESLLQEYKQRFIDNNINGRVLMACDLNELRDALNMKFGDWQLFKCWIIASRNKDQKLSQIGEKKVSDRSTSCYNSCAEGSQESNCGSPKQSAYRKGAHYGFQLPSLSENRDDENIPYASHSPYQSIRKSSQNYKPIKSASQGIENSSPQHPNVHNLHHSADSGFVSTEVDQSNRLMLNWQRQACVVEPTQCSEGSTTCDFSSANKANIHPSAHAEELPKIIHMDSLIPDLTTYKRNSETIDNTLHAKGNVEEVSLDVDINSEFQSLINVKDLDDISGKVDYDVDVNSPSAINAAIFIESEYPRPPSLSEVPLPPPTMLDVVHWPMNPPAEFDDIRNSEPLHSPPSELDETKLKFRDSITEFSIPTVVKLELPERVNDEQIPLLGSQSCIESEKENNFLTKPASVDCHEKRKSLKLSRSITEKGNLGDEAELTS